MLANPVVMKDCEHLAIWTWLLLNVVWKDVDVLFLGKRMTLKAGQMTTGIKKISDDLCISQSKVQRVLKFFESEKQIEQQTTTKCRLITVKNWQQYQETEKQNEKPLTNDWKTNDKPLTTKEEVKNIRIEESKFEDSNINNSFLNSIATNVAEKEKTDVEPTQMTTNTDGGAVNQLMEVFQMNLNPTINYGNKTQRRALQELIHFMGIEKLKNLIKYCAKIQGEEFAPIITTPYQLKEKLGQLIAYSKKIDNKSNKPSIASI